MMFDPISRFGMRMPFRIDLVEHQHLRFRLVMNPLFAWLVEMDVAQAVLADDDLFVLVGDFALARIHDDGPVVAAVEFLLADSRLRAGSR